MIFFGDYEIKFSENGSKMNNIKGIILILFDRGWDFFSRGLSRSWNILFKKVLCYVFVLRIEWNGLWYFYFLDFIIGIILLMRE